MEYFKKKFIVINQNARLKSHIDMNTDLRKKSKNDFENDFFTLINNAVFGKTMENWRKHRYKTCQTERRINYLVAEPIYHNTKFFTENLLYGYRQFHCKCKNR